MNINDVVQFNEKHKWTGSLGIITEKKQCGEARQADALCIFCRDVPV